MRRGVALRDYQFAATRLTSTPSPHPPQPLLRSATAHKRHQQISSSSHSHSHFSSLTLCATTRYFFYSSSVAPDFSRGCTRQNSSQPPRTRRPPTTTTTTTMDVIAGEDRVEDSLADQFEEQASLQQQQRTKGGKAKGGRGGKGEGGGAPTDSATKKQKDISRALSRLLRHQALNAGIKLDKEGYAPLDKVLQYGPIRSLKATVQDILAVTADNEKQRFSMKPAHPADLSSPSPSPSSSDALTAMETADPSYWLIRANQGHSIPLESEALLRPITLLVDGGDSGVSVPVPPVVVHGTYFGLWEQIVASGGLKRMGRNHVHCSTGLPEDNGAGTGAGAGAAVVVSGMRTDAELLIYVDVRRSLEDKAMTWWISDNGVVLTEGVGEDGCVPLQYFKEVVGRKEDVGLLWKDGEKVADLPESVRGRRPPPQKGGGGGSRGRGGGGGRGRAGGGRGGQGRGGRGGV